MKHPQGFSLVELSIVLVILGLLVGGVLGGQALIKAAEQRALLTDADKYRVAVNAFQARFDGLPGDFIYAQNFWPQCTNHTMNPCNGNGDGIIGNSANVIEVFRALEHLSRAGLLESSIHYNGQYAQSVINGVVAFITGSTSSDIPQFVPSRYKSSATYYFANYTGNRAVIVAADRFSTAANAAQLVPLITPQDAYLMDLKTDDGKPDTGSFLSANGMHAGSWAISTCVQSGDYNLGATSETPQCVLLFVK